MAEDWIGRAVSIVCDESLGVFQGMIKDINASEITIVRAFRNGVPLRKQNAEIVLKSVDIRKIDLIPTVNGENSSVTHTVINKPTPVKLPNFLNILGAKERERQQQLQLQKLEQQQQQRQQKHHHQQNQQQKRHQQQQRLVSLTSLSAFNGIGDGGGGGDGNDDDGSSYSGNGKGGSSGDRGGGGGGGDEAASSSSSYYGNSTLSAKMENMKLLNTNLNGLRNTPSNNVRASSAQQQRQQHQHHHQSYGGGSVGNNNSSPPERSSSTATVDGTPNSVAMFFGGMIPPKVEVKLGASYSSTLTTSLNSTSGGQDLSFVTNSSTTPNKSNVTSNGVSGADDSSNINDSIESCAGGSQPIDIKGGLGGAGGSGNHHNHHQQSQQQHQQSFTNGNGNNGNGRRNGYNNGYNNNNTNNNTNISKKMLRNKMRGKQHHQTFATPVDDPSLNVEFDFESNLALFDKRRIWNDIESCKDQQQHQQHKNSDAPGGGRNNAGSRRHEHKMNEKKYRHDENVLESAPLQLRQIKSSYASCDEFVTDEGLIIPTIPPHVRTTIELTAETAGLALQRQVDLMARGASDLAILLLGGARRLTPNNSHQWPKIAIICDRSEDGIGMRSTDIAAATGRQLASHGLTVLLYLEQPISAHQSIEISLFKATDNTIVHSIDALPKPDLVILSTNAAKMSEHIKKWLSDNRASILAIDPPPCGINDVAIKYSILPILPLNGISSNNCGKLYLCNLGIPDKFYRDCGIKYKSPYGHKYVIPIHPKD